MASSTTAAAASSTLDGVGGQQQVITTEVPEILKRLTLLIVKSFYSKEHCVVADYIQRNVCVKEDKLREFLKVDQKYLRQLLITLKVDKIVKERTVSEEGGGPRPRKFNYYFINYKAMLNVARYKFHHMRTKLEGREKSDVQKSTYRCTNNNCKKNYDVMDIGKIYDMNTGEMKYSILKIKGCNHLVAADETAGPSEATRSSMAKFNEQTSGMFSILQSLDGIRFSREILEPPIAEPAKDEQLANQKVVRVGERAFNASGKTRSELYSGGITVSIGDQVERLPEAKEAVPWLQNNQHQGGGGSTNLLLNDPNVVMDFSPLPSAAIDSFGASIPSSSVRDTDGPAEKRPKQDDIAAMLMEEEEGSSLQVNQDGSTKQSNGAVEDADETGTTQADEDYVMVQGEKVPADEITPEIIAKMTPSEKEAYINSVQNSYDFY
uniref:HTH TFE/IIEalpha-type domain-containing protein n=1 Tax=Ditylenchus dipsaci TaxID=166011 RepID=A0A915DXP2_9BILA